MEMLSYAAGGIARTAGAGAPEISTKTGAWKNKGNVELPADVEDVDERTGKPVCGGKIRCGGEGSPHRAHALGDKQ